MSDYTADFINALTSPKRHFGEVPFYWWNGSPLNKDRLKEQIEMLAEKGIAGIQINYAHINGGGEDSLPHGGYGRSIKGEPEQFSDEWWEFFSFAAKECEKHGMSIGMGDYTIAWIGNGYFTDKVASLPDMHAKYLTCEKQMLFSGDENALSEDVLFAVSYEDFQCTRPVIIYEKGKGVIAPVSGLCEAYIIYIHGAENSINPLDPRSGTALRSVYFEEFMRRVPDVKEGTLNYFFQDELMFGVDTKYLWSDSLRQGIQEKYSYDIAGFIPHLFFNLGDITPAIRLHTADVKAEITENCYFRPIFDFHNEKGLIYGCDQAGRGKDPGEFSDYFRAVRWFTAPGNDTPGRAADLIKVKVNSSIAHLYNRPRVWLEGYHSSGWGTTLDSITAPTSDNFIFGANLLNLHGLYYSTNGGFFEWAPPDFHFRMPYWDHEKAWLDKYKRMSALLTTGSHFCDAAVYYPVSSHDYGENHKECTDYTFLTAEELFSRGLDFDFIDFQSIENANCINGRIVTATESYKALIFAGVDCVRYSSILKAKELLACGGAVIFCGITPYASDRAGKNDEVLQKDIAEILSHPNALLAPSPEEALNFINTKITRSFFPDYGMQEDKVYVHARKHGEDRLFFVRYAKKDSVCRFEATGSPYILDTYKNEVLKLEGTIEADGFTFIKMPFPEGEDTLILFTDSETDYEKVIDTNGFSEEKINDEIILDGFWDFSLIPTLNNTYGDYFLPSGGTIGAEAVFLDASRVNNADSIPESYEYYHIPICTSDALKTVYTKDKTEEICAFLAENPGLSDSDSFLYEDISYSFEERRIHSRYGFICTDDHDCSLYEQGYHGLKGRIYDDNIYFTENCAVSTFIYAEKDEKSLLKAGSIKPQRIYLNGKKVTEGEILLRKGKNSLTLAFIYDKSLAPDYKNRSSVKRTSVHILRSEAETPSYEMSVPSFASPDYYKPSANSFEGDIFCFGFDSIPGFTSMEINLFGELLCAFNNGKPMKTGTKDKGLFGSSLYTAEVSEADRDISRVTFLVRAEKGYEYTDIIPCPIKLSCTKGRIRTGDLSEAGALQCYSGKMCYEKTVSLNKLYPDERFILEIDDLGATADVEINGKPAAVFTFRPFRADITDAVRHGENRFRITVANTLCNHYSKIPSRYSNFPKDSASGLIGPVRIKVTEYSKGE